MIHKKLLSLLVLLLTVASGAWAQDNRFFLEVSGTSATLKWGEPTSNDNPSLYPGSTWKYQENDWTDKSGITTITVDASCTNCSEENISALFYKFVDLQTINNIENIKTDAVKYLGSMFQNCTSLQTLDLSSWNTENVTSMSGMFRSCTSLQTLDISSFNTGKVDAMGYMFKDCSSLTTIYVSDGWSTDQLTSSSSSTEMFNGCVSLPNWDNASPVIDKTNAHTGDGGYLTYKASTDYKFTVDKSEHGSGTIKFFIDGKEVKGANKADEDKTVTVTVTPDEGWILNSVTATTYINWGDTRRKVKTTIPVLGDVDMTPVANQDNTWIFKMPSASVAVNAEYQKISNLAFKPADKTKLMTVKVGDEVRNLNGSETVNIRRIQNVLEGTPVNLKANTGYKFRKVEVKKGVDYSFDLSTLTSNFEAMDGDILYGTTDKTVTIPNGAHVTLQGVNITSGAAIVCNGNATITLAAGTENTVTSTQEYNSGIRAGGNNTTLTINGTGKLTVQGAKRGAGIGSNRRGVCGNIVIEDGEIIATTGDYGAGIGSGYHATCGNITIKGGTITATGGNCGAGIGSSFDTAICGDILISGGTITANGGNKAAGIGTGSAQQGWPSTCGNITITDGVTSVTATKGSSAALHSIGKGQNVEDKAYCGTVTIGGTVYYDGTDYQNGGSDYLKTNPLVYEPGK